jgi:hypothetical protein
MPRQFREVLDYFIKGSMVQAMQQNSEITYIRVKLQQELVAPALRLVSPYKLEECDMLLRPVI